MQGAKYKTVSSSSLSPTDNRKRKEVQVRVPAFIAEILEIEWTASVAAAREKKALPLPHWLKGEKLEEENQPNEQKYPTGSKRPGVYLVKSKQPNQTLTVKLNVTKSNDQEPEGILSATLGSIKMEGKCPTSIGTHVVKVSILNLPETIEHHEGDVAWTLRTSSKSFSIGKATRLELFIIFNKPGKFYAQGVWIEALRFLFKKAKVSGVGSQQSAAVVISKYCHSGHGMVYDTYSGAPQFGSFNIGGPAFNLMGYLKKQGKQGNTVNCYDQAAAIQSLSGALGVALDWIYLSPYGYINETNLVGVGQCNNPFFNSNGTRPVINSRSPDRTGFGNHAFAALNTKIFDACAGPHLGTESLRQYAESAIDADVTIRNTMPGLTKEQYWKTLESLPNPLTGLTGLA